MNLRELARKACGSSTHHDYCRACYDKARLQYDGDASATQAMSGSPMSGGAPAISYADDDAGIGPGNPFAGRDNSSILGGRLDDMPRPRQPTGMQSRRREGYSKTFERCVLEVQAKNRSHA